jgi:preprotein translocase subunit SecE
MAVPQSITPQEPFMTRVMKWPQEVRDYYEDLKKEMRLVSWPTWNQVRATTTVVIVAVFVFAAYFWVVDLVMGFLMSKLFAFAGK